METIFALATARGKSGVAVIRLSGPDAWEIGTRLAGQLPPAGQAGLRVLRRPGGEILDRALVLSFAGPRSFTGEDVVEFHCHGSLAVIAAVESCIAETGLARLAEPGEFTQRALLNGRMDLGEVEGLSDLISAETEAQRRQAEALLSGGLRDFAEKIRSRLVQALALIEASIDFADEEVPVDVVPDVRVEIAAASDLLAHQLKGYAAAERVREGFEVAIVGAPNAGKSTLLNRIAGRDIAITSEIAGTTRDVIEARLDLQGLAVTFLDTAGLRETEDAIERIGVDRARQRAERADLRVFLIDGLASEAADLGVAGEPGDLFYRTKADLTGEGISAATGQGIEAMLADVHGALAGRVLEGVVASHERHRLAILGAAEALRAAAGRLEAGPEELEIVALHLRDGIGKLDSLVGRVDVEDVLGEIFSQFCIGK